MSIFLKSLNYFGKRKGRWYHLLLHFLSEFLSQITFKRGSDGDIKLYITETPF